jgi:hypothetical protein
MRIIYVANHGNNKHSDDTEGHITRAFEALGHEVLRLPQERIILEDLPEGDVLLYHKGGPLIESLLKKIPYLKVCWYFDKIWAERIGWFHKIYPLTDLICLTDWTWGMKFNKCVELRQGIGNIEKGKATEYNFDVAFIGSLYHDRVEWFNRLNDKFQVKNINNAFNQELNNICASVPIIVAPKYPQDNYYWSNRPYLITGSGGFLIHPYLTGLYEEWGDNLVYYKDDQDLYKKIDYYLKNPNERKIMQKKMVNFCREHFTYKQRVEELISWIKKYE